MHNLRGRPAHPRPRILLQASSTKRRREADTQTALKVERPGAPDCAPPPGGERPATATGGTRTPRARLRANAEGDTQGDRTKTPDVESGFAQRFCRSRPRRSRICYVMHDMAFIHAVVPNPVATSGPGEPDATRGTHIIIQIQVLCGRDRPEFWAAPISNLCRRARFGPLVSSNAIATMRRIAMRSVCTLAMTDPTPSRPGSGPPIFEKAP